MKKSSRSPVCARCSTAKFSDGRKLTVKAKPPDGTAKKFTTTVRIDTPQEILYYQHGGILQYVLRQLAGKA